MARKTRYARRDEPSIAWVSAGAGPLDPLFLPGFISHVEHAWEDPAWPPLRGEAIASGTVYGTVVGSGPVLQRLGMHELKGVPGHWPLYAMWS